MFPPINASRNVWNATAPVCLDYGRSVTEIWERDEIVNTKRSRRARRKYHARGFRLKFVDIWPAYPPHLSPSFRPCLVFQCVISFLHFLHKNLHLLVVYIWFCMYLQLAYVTLTHAAMAERVMWRQTEMPLVRALYGACRTLAIPALVKRFKPVLCAYRLYVLNKHTAVKRVQCINWRLSVNKVSIRSLCSVCWS